MLARMRKLTTQQIGMWQVLDVTNYLTTEQVAAFAHCTTDAAVKRLKRLAENNIVEMKKGGRKGAYLWRRKAHQVHHLALDPKAVPV
jgi:Fic family protein